MKKTKRGFTIVELVIVIAVIAILAAILIPVFSNVTSKAQETARASEIKNAHSAFVADQALVNGTYAELYDYLYHDGEKYYSWDETNEKWVEATKGTETKQNTNDYGGWDLYK